MQSGTRGEGLINELSLLRRFELQSRMMNLKPVGSQFRKFKGNLWRTKIIGLVGFEPTASCTRGRRSTKLSHSPAKIDVDLAGLYVAHFDLAGKPLHKSV